MDTVRVESNLWERVLLKYCSVETKDAYSALTDGVAQAKMTEALKACVQQTLFNSLDCGTLTKSMPNSLQFPHNDDNLLHKAMQSEWPQMCRNDVSDLKLTIKTWGKKLTRQKCLENHDLNVKFLSSNSSTSVMPFLSSNSTVRKDQRSTIDLSKLKKICIADLNLFAPAIGCYVEGTLIAPAFSMTAAQTVFEDEYGEVTDLSIYNMVQENNQQVAKEKFPKGLKIKICEPLYKICIAGNRAIRVDTPADIIFDVVLNNADEIRSQAKAYMESGEQVSALKLYIDGLNLFKGTIQVLLNNRAQVHIKLNQFEDALLDAAAAMMFCCDAKAKARYQLSAEHLGLKSECKDSILLIWNIVLEHLGKTDQIMNEHATGSKEGGNAAYKQGRYEDAQKEYTTALQSEKTVCILLNNIAVVCLKLQILQTAVAAASACLRITADLKHMQKAHYSLAKAFSMMGEIKLSKLSANSEISLSSFWEDKSDPRTVAIELMKKFTEVSKQRSALDGIMSIKDEVVPTDFLNANAMQHVFITGKGRGLVAARDIRHSELLLVDHPVINDTKNPSISITSNATTKIITEKDESGLIRKILSLIEYDGLLGKKLLLLDTRGKIEDCKILDLIDLDSMAYWNLSLDVLPFLAQTPKVLGCDIGQLSEAFVHKVVSINRIGLGLSKSEKASGLCLQISLFNHSDEPNCFQIKLGDSMAVFTRCDIQKGSELTIAYLDDAVKDKKSVMFNKWGI